MAERPTKRERKDEAKKRRMEDLRRRQRRARMRKVYSYGIVAAVVAAIVGYFVLNSIAHSNKLKVAKELAAKAGCEVAKANLKDEGQQHIQPPQTVNYLTQPATSGNHYNLPGQAPTFTGIHDQPVQDEGQVHNLEHGHVFIQYKPGEVSDAVLKGLENLVREHPTSIALAPRPEKMAFKLAFTAWRSLQGCNSPNEKAVEAARLFYDLYQGNAPESVPGTPVLPSVSPSAGGSPTGGTPTETGSPRPTPTGTSTKKLSDFLPTSTSSPSPS